MYRGNSLVGHAINHALGSKYIDSIILSSDSQAILNYAKPPVIPLRRPAYLASDHARSEALIVHALHNHYPPDSYLPVLPDLFILLQPTSPNRTTADIDACLQLTASSGSCVSVNPAGLLNGACYAAHSTAFLASLSLASSTRYTMPADRSLDIDTLEDFQK